MGESQARVARRGEVLSNPLLASQQSTSDEWQGEFKNRRTAWLSKPASPAANSTSRWSRSLRKRPKTARSVGHQSPEVSIRSKRAVGFKTQCWRKRRHDPVPFNGLLWGPRCPAELAASAAVCAEDRVM